MPAATAILGRAAAERRPPAGSSRARASAPADRAAAEAGAHAA